MFVYFVMESSYFYKNVIGDNTFGYILSSISECLVLIFIYLSFEYKEYRGGKKRLSNFSVIFQEYKQILASKCLWYFLLFCWLIDLPLPVSQHLKYGKFKVYVDVELGQSFQFLFLLHQFLVELVSKLKFTLYFKYLSITWACTSICTCIANIIK